MSIFQCFSRLLAGSPHILLDYDQHNPRCLSIINGYFNQPDPSRIIVNSLGIISMIIFALIDWEKLRTMRQLFFIEKVVSSNLKLISSLIIAVDDE